VTELDNFRIFVNWIADAKEFKLDSKESSGRKKLAAVHALAVTRYPPLTGAALRSRVNNADNLEMSDAGLYFYMKPDAQMPDVLPVMTFGFDFRDPEFHVLRIRVALLHQIEEHKLGSVGFRFETPESKDEDEDEDGDGEGEERRGKHNYFHAQPINRFIKRDNKTKLPHPQWMATKYPTFPLEAKTPCGLLSTFLCSIYSQDGIRGMLPWLKGPDGRSLLSVIKDCEYVKRAMPIRR
jgi:hypothetical protein